MKLELADRDNSVKVLSKENLLLRKEFEGLLRECEDYANKTKSVEL